MGELTGFALSFYTFKTQNLFYPSEILAFYTPKPYCSRKWLCKGFQSYNFKVNSKTMILCFMHWVLVQGNKSQPQGLTLMENAEG